jgi:hypothetical protein
MIFNDTLKIIKRRRSIRSYTDEPVSCEEMLRGGVRAQGWGGYGGGGAEAEPRYFYSVNFAQITGPGQSPAPTVGGFPGQQVKGEGYQKKDAFRRPLILTINNKMRK